MPRQKVKETQLAVTLRVQGLSDPEIRSYISSLKSKYQEYLVPLEEGRKVIDQSMGARSLTELLYAARDQEAV